MKERSGPRGAQSHLTERIKSAQRHQRENLLKEKPALRSGPRYQRANLLKEELALMQIKHLYATALLQKSIFDLKECKK